MARTKIRAAAAAVWPNHPDLRQAQEAWRSPARLNADGSKPGQRYLTVLLSLIGMLFTANAAIAKKRVAVVVGTRTGEVEPALPAATP